MTEIFKSGDASLKKCEVKEHSDVYGMFRDMIDATNKAAKKARTVRTSMVMRDDRLLSQGTVRQARIDFLKLRKFVSKEKDKKDKEKERETLLVKGYFEASVVYIRHNMFTFDSQKPTRKRKKEKMYREENRPKRGRLKQEQQQLQYEIILRGKAYQNNDSIDNKV